MHPGFKTGLDFRLHMLWGLTVMDAVETMYRATRPYEIHKGDTQKVYDQWILPLMKTFANISTSKIAYPKKALEDFDACIADFNKIEIDRSVRKPRVAFEHYGQFQFY